MSHKKHTSIKTKLLSAKIVMLISLTIFLAICTAIQIKFDVNLRNSRLALASNTTQNSTTWNDIVSSSNTPFMFSIITATFPSVFYSLWRRVGPQYTIVIVTSALVFIIVPVTIIFYYQWQWGFYLFLLLGFVPIGFVFAVDSYTLRNLKYNKESAGTDSESNSSAVSE